MGSGLAGQCAHTVPLTSPGSGPLTPWSHGPMLSSFKLTAPRRGILGKKNWGLHSREGPSPQLSVSQEHVCHTNWRRSWRGALWWVWCQDGSCGHVQRKWGGAPGPACDEHGNRVGNQLLHLPLAGSVANSHSRGDPGNWCLPHVPVPQNQVFSLLLHIWEHLT